MKECTVRKQPKNLNKNNLVGYFDQLSLGLAIQSLSNYVSK